MTTVTDIKREVEARLRAENEAEAAMDAAMNEIELTAAWERYECDGWPFTARQHADAIFLRNLKRVAPGAFGA